MEDRVRALEVELNTLKATLNTSKWWLGILGAFLVGGLGATNFFAIPASINQAFVEKGGQGLIDKLTVSEKSAAVSSATLRTAADQIGEFESVQLYQCPNDGEAGKNSAAWYSFGCLGQLSNSQSCRNLAWRNSQLDAFDKDCTPVTYFKKK